MAAAPNPFDQSRFTVDYDRWDRQTVQRLLQEIQEFQASRLKLSESVAGDLAFDVWQDLWLSLWKARPDLLPEEEIRPTHLVNRMVIEEAQNLQELTSLRVHTMGDNVGSALASITMEPEMEILYDRVSEAQKAANALDKIMQELAAKQEEQRDAETIYREWTEENDPEDPENQEQASDLAEELGQIADEISELEGQAQAAGEELQEKLEELGPTVRASLKKGMKQATQELSDFMQASDMWGSDPGQLRRLDAKIRIEMAKKLNTPKFKRVAQLFGPMRHMADQAQKRKVDYLREEIYDLENGADLTRILAVHLALLDDEDSEDLFWSDYVDGKLLQYKMRGQDRVAKGGIVYLHDGSGSMAGDREIWAKAVGLTLLHVARKQGRSMWAIQFGSSHEQRLDDFSDPKNIEPQAVMDFAEFFYNGGTSFQQPLDHAVKILEEEHDRLGAIKSDIVFATDGYASVSPSWMDHFKEVQAKLDFKCWGINIGGVTSGEPFNTICDGRVCSLKDLTSGDDVRHIFGGI